MFKKILPLSCLVFTPFVNANYLAGQLSTENGQPVKNALVEVIGGSQKTQTSEYGHFAIKPLPEGHYELHIVADGYVHKNIHIDVPATGLEGVKITLSQSPIEVIDVTASSFHTSQIESAMPVSVLSGEQLRQQQATTIGDSLKKVVGVHSNHHGSVAASPIIRGLDGPRVLMVQNGLDSGDVSRSGADHIISSNASTAKQIEVLRGPATLFYGNGAIGGVVNIVDGRIPQDTATEGQASLLYANNNSGKNASASYKTGFESTALYLDGFAYDNGNYHSAESEIENSDAQASGFTLGASQFLDNGSIGASYGFMNKQYGIPGHSHSPDTAHQDGHEDGHEDEHEDEHLLHEDDHDGEHDGEHAAHEERVYADMWQHRGQVKGEFNFADAFVQQVNFALGYTDYRHDEIEDGAVATRFDKQTFEIRNEFLHKEYHDWRGGWNVHYKRDAQQSKGEEAYAPDSTTENLAIAWIEEKHAGDFLIQLGMRLDEVKIKADPLSLQEIEFASHHDEHAEPHEEPHENEHEGEHDEHAITFNYSEHSFTPLSLTAGVVWDFTEGYNLGLAVSHAQRAPSVNELFAFGPHLASGVYEVGRAYELHEHDEHVDFELNASDLKLEKSNNLDLSFRKFSGNTGFVFNVFYNNIDNYYYQQKTEFTALVSAHEHEDEHLEEPEEAHAEDALNLDVYQYQSADAKLYGYEAQVFWQPNSDWKLEVGSDAVRAKLKSGENLPRTSPMRVYSHVKYQAVNYSIEGQLSRYFSQKNISQNETATTGYTVLDVYFNYYTNLAGQELKVFAKAENLTDEYAKVHTSLIKDEAPIMGRNISFGITTYF
ncbi:TonB-dependent receptor [Catenovulum sediminis]|uniref:TonB-dependent receptor n=1 Tax=Catenovulum sediminis TaxID=1740262 RepID=UPI00117E5489|nr:TonB-dependent receptor [Catenovulum sediminis]